MTEEESPVAKGSVALLASFVAIAALNYAFAVTMSWLLPVERYGAVGVGQAVLLTGATIAGAGFPWALARAIAQARSPETQARAFRAALLGNGLLGLGLMVVVAGVALSGRVEPAAIYTPILMMASVVIGILALNAVLSGALQGLLLLRELALVRLTEVVVKSFAGLFLVMAGLGVVGAMGGFVGGAVVATTLAAIMLRKFPMRLTDGWTDRSVFTAAGPLFVAMVGFALLSQLDILTLKAFTADPSSDFLAGQYQVAVTMGRIPYFAGLAVFGAIFPHISRAADATGESRAYASLGLKYTLLFIVPVGIVLAVVPDAVIRLFFSSRYDRSAESLAVVAIASVLLCIGYGFATLLQARGHQWLPAAVLTLAVPTQIIVASQVVPTLGMTGAAAAFGVAAAVVLALLAPLVTSSFQLRVSMSQGVRYGTALAVLATTLLLLPHGDRLLTIGSLAAAAVVYLIALVVLQLVTRRDVETLGGAFGSRGLRVRGHIADIVDRAQMRSGRA